MRDQRDSHRDRGWARKAACFTISVSAVLSFTRDSKDARTEDKEPDAGLRVGFGETDITPKVGGKTVFLAGFGHNRKATAVHDPLFARAVVLQHGNQKVALVSVDVVGLFHESVERVRKRLPDFTYVLVSSTHNHE